MSCKYCSHHEYRARGFCSIECRRFFEYEEEIAELKATLEMYDANGLILAGKLAHVNKVLREVLFLSSPDRNRQAVENLEIYTQDYREWKGEGDE